MVDLFIELAGFALRKAYFFLRYRNPSVRAEKEALFLSKDQLPLTLKIPAILFLIVIGGALLIAIGRAIYDLTHGNPIY